MTAAGAEVARRALVSAAWLALAYLLLNPLMRALTALVTTWTEIMADPLGGVR